MKPIEVNEFISLSSKDFVVVDTRKTEIFSDGFLANSISIEFEENFINTFQELLGNNQKVLLVTDEKEVSAIQQKLKNAGISNVYGYLKGQFDLSKIPAKKIDMLIAIDTEELRIDYRFDEFYLIDVRTAEEFEVEHFEHAENIMLADIDQMIIELDPDNSYYIYGHSSTQAITAGSLFKKNGFNRIKVVAGKFENIKAAGIPLNSKSKTPSTKFSNN